MKDLKNREEELDRLYQSIFKLAEARDLNAMILRCEEVHILAAELDHQETLGLSYKFKGFAYYSLNEIDKAITSYETAELIFENFGFIKELISTKLSLGVLYRNLRENRKALEVLKDSLNLCEKYNLKNSAIYNNIGSIYAGQDNYSAALEYYNNAILVEQNMENPDFNQIVRYRVNSAGMYIHVGNLRKAENMFRKTIQYCQANKDYDFLISSYRGLANALLKQNKYEEAEEILNTVKKLVVDLNYYIESVDIGIFLANLNKYLKNDEKELFNLIEALSIARESLKNKEKLVLERILLYFKEKEDWRNAFLYLNDLRNLEQSDFLKEREGGFLEFQQKFESEQKDKLLEQQKGFNLKLKEKNLELAEANEDLEQFNHGVSHDLKEPLRLIKGRLTYLKLRALNKLDTEELDALASSLAATTRMEKMLEDLYKFSSLGKNLREEDEVDLNEVVAIVQADLQMRIKDNNAKLFIDNLPKVKGYKSMYVQLFQNLINNAIKFRKPELDPKIKVGYNLEEKFHVITVMDNGMGIKQENLSKIFKLFKRLDESKHIEGSGVGLSIVQKIVKKMQGEISLASEYNFGTTVSIKIPL